MKSTMLKQIFKLTRLMLEILGRGFCRTRAKTNGHIARTAARMISHTGQARRSLARLIETRSAMKFFRAGNGTGILPSGMFGAEGRRGVTRISRRSRAPCARERERIRSPESAFGGGMRDAGKMASAGVGATSESRFGVVLSESLKPFGCRANANDAEFTA